MKHANKADKQMLSLKSQGYRRTISLYLSQTHCSKIEVLFV